MMRYGLSLLVLLAWALWLGGLMALFLMVSHLFNVDRALAVQAAPRMFIAFERYQIFLAAAALTATAVWRLTEVRGVLTALFVLFTLAAIGAILQTTLISPRMHRLREAG